MNNDLFAQPSVGTTVLNTIIFLVAAAGFLYFYFGMLIDCLVRPIRNKVLWFVLILLLGPLLGILYFFTGRKQLEV